MNNYTIEKKLKEANIEFTVETGFSGFTYTRFVFKTRKEAIKAEKALGNIVVNRYFKQYALTVY